MIHIKYISFSLIFGLLCFYFGINAGADKMGMHRVATETTETINKPENKYGGLEPEVFYRLRLNDALSTYGRYLDSYSYYAPDLNSLDRRTKEFMIEIKNRMLELNPNYFTDSYNFYDQYSKEYEGAQSNETFLLKKQLKLVEEKLKK